MARVWRCSSTRVEAKSQADVLCTIRDRDGNYRGYVAKDGECRNNRNVLLGFINAEDGACGTAEEEYLGCISEQSAFNDALCIVEDALDERCGTLDMGTGYIKDAQDRIVVGGVEPTPLPGGRRALPRRSRSSRRPASARATPVRISASSRASATGT